MLKKETLLELEQYIDFHLNSFVVVKQMEINYSILENEQQIEDIEEFIKIHKKPTLKEAVQCQG